MASYPEIDNGVKNPTRKNFLMKEDAAREIDRFVVENKMYKRQLNFPEDYPDWNTEK
jgi:hypothetical protein